MYKNEKLAQVIRSYIIKYLQNLNKVLIDLKQARIIIANIKLYFFNLLLKL